MNGSLPASCSIEVLKKQARRLREKLEGDGLSVSHSKSLELLAHQHGFKDWNTMHAAAGNGPPPCPVGIGSRVRGRYLGQSFVGEVVGLQSLGAGERFRVTLEFDAPVDVVTFESFSNFRTRVSCIVDRWGRTSETTSDGRPHMQLEIPS